MKTDQAMKTPKKPPMTDAEVRKALDIPLPPEEFEEQKEEFGKQVHAAGPTSDFAHADLVEIRTGLEYGSVQSQSRVRARKGNEGVVVGQSFVAGSDSRHAGKVCRGVVMKSGDLITTPEENLKQSTSMSVSFSGVSQERWNRIFKKRGKR